MPPMPRPRRRPFAFVRLAPLLAAALAAPLSLAQAPLPPPAAAPYGAVVPTLTLPAPGQTLPAPMVSPLPAVPPAATVPAGTLPGIVQPLPPPPPTPLFPGFSSPTTSPNPFAPLPAGAVIGPGGPVVPGPPLTKSNSVVIPPIDAEVVWQQMVDTMDDFFKIQSEQRVVFANGIPAEGRIDTYPQTGATLLEPWRGDSVGFRERLESTLQSIRRSGSMRLIPDPSGWRVEAVVLKELENLPRPMRATAGGASFRNDDSLYRYGTPLATLGQQVGDQPRPVANPTPNLGWIPLGRDPLLEQKMLGKVLGRLGVAPVPQAGPAYQAADPATGLPATLPGPATSTTSAAPMATGPVYGAPIRPEQLPPGALVAPGPPVPIESLPVPAPK
jgi:hypothetical protein